jgi:hypothetical protein
MIYFDKPTSLLNMVERQIRSLHIGDRLQQTQQFEKTTRPSFYACTKAAVLKSVYFLERGLIFYSSEHRFNNQLLKPNQLLELHIEI